MRKAKLFASMCLVVAVSLMAASVFAEAPTIAEGPTNSNPLSDVRVRQAIAYAIDMDTIADTLLEGKAIVADSQTPNGAWKVDGLNPYAYDPEKAKELLAAANWDPDYTLDLVFYYGDQLTVDMMTAIQAYLEMVGIKMNFKKLEGDLAAQLWTPPADPVNGPSAVEWDLCYGAVAAMALQEYYHRYRTGEGSNSHTPGNPELNALIDAINSSADPAEQKAAFAELQRYENEYLPAIPLYYQQMFIYESDRVDRNGGGYGNPQYNYDWNIVNWTVTPDADGKQVLYTNTAPVEFFETPWFNPGIYMASKVVFDRLLMADPTMTPSKGSLAADYSLSDDALRLTMTLKDGLKWHDGSDLTAEDVKWSVEYALKVSALNAVVAKTFESLEGAQAVMDGSAEEVSGIVVDGNTLTFSFAQLDPNVLLSFTQFAPLPKAYFADVDPLQFQQAAFWQKPIGSGPFKVQEVQMNDYTVLVPFEEYHGGVAKIDEIVMYPSGENDSNVIPNAAAGKLDYGFTKNVGDVKALEEMDNMRLTAVDIPYTRSLFVNKFPKQ